MKVLSLGFVIEFFLTIFGRFGGKKKEKN